MPAASMLNFTDLRNHLINSVGSMFTLIYSPSAAFPGNMHLSQSSLPPEVTGVAVPRGREPAPSCVTSWRPLFPIIKKADSRTQIPSLSSPPPSLKVAPRH